MHRIVRATALAVVLWSLLAVGPAAGVGSTGDAGTHAQFDGRAQNDTANGTTITITATGEAQAQPDAAVVHVSVTATAASPGDAAEQVATNASRLRTALANASVPDDAVRTTYYDVYERGLDDPRNETRYVAEQGFAVETDNASRAGELVDLALANGASTVQGVAFTLSDEARSELRNEALGDAVSSADSQADAVARSADLSVTGVRAIETVDPGFVRGQGAAEALTEDASTQIDGGPLTVTAVVRVTYVATERPDATENATTGNATANETVATEAVSTT